MQTVTVEKDDLTRNAVTSRIKAALQRRSKKRWSVTGGRGTAYGWITIDAPKSRCTWERAEVGKDEHNYPKYEERDTGAAFGHMGPEDRKELATLLGLENVHFQGVSIPAGHDYYLEYIDRAEGRTPLVFGKPYWD